MVNKSSNYMCKDDDVQLELIYQSWGCNSYKHLLVYKLNITHNWLNVCKSEYQMAWPYKIISLLLGTGIQKLLQHTSRIFKI